MDIRAWLTNHQLDKFAEAFEQNEVAVEDLGELTHEDLRDGLGIKRFADRKLLLDAILGFVGEREQSSKTVVYPEGLEASRMPTYLAHPWHALCAEDHPRVKLHWLTDTAELAVRWAVAVALAEVLAAHDLTVPKRLAKLIRGDIERPTLGRWLGILRELSNNPPPNARLDPRIFSLYEEVFEPMFASENRGGTLETSLLMLRNQVAHGGGMSQEHASTLLAAHMPGISNLLEKVLDVTDCATVIAVESGRTSKLRGLEPEPVEPPPKVEIDHDGAWLVKDGDALPLLPLAIYEPVHMIDSAGELKDKPGGPAAQVFTRASHDRLSYTPLGRDEAHSEVLDVEFFRGVFRLDEELDPQDAISSVDGVHWDDAIKEARELAQDLIGRDQELKTIKNWMKKRDPYNDDVPNIGWISGGPGLGKSMIMARVASDYASGKHRGFYFHKFGGGGNARSNRRAFLKLLEAALYSWPPLQQITKSPDVTLDGDELLDSVQARIEAIQQLEAPHPKAPKPAAWIIIDNFDEVIEQDPTFIEVVQRFALPGTVWLMCGRPEHGLDEEFRNNSKAEHLFPEGLPVMSAPDIRAMLLEGMGNARYALLKRDEDDGSGEVHNAFLERVVEGAKGLPLYVNLLLDDLRAGALTVEDDDKLPDGLSDYYDGLMERGGLGTVSRDLPMIVSLLARTEEPLDAKSIAALLTPTMQDYDIYLRRVKSALRVGQSLMQTSTTPEGTLGYSLYHQSFREYIGGRPASPDAPATPPSSLIAETVYEAERVLYRSAERWEELPAGNLRNHMFRWGTTYALDLQGDAGLEEARKRLTNYAYLHTRLDSLPPSAVIDLVVEYGALARRTPSGPERDHLQLWEAFFRERAHILSRTGEDWPSSRILLQLAIEHADNSPVTHAAEAWMKQGGGEDWLWLRRPTRPAKLKENFALRVYEGHEDRIEGVEVLTEDRLLSWSVDHSVRLWNRTTGEEIATLGTHEGSVDGACLLDEGRRAASWSRDGGLVVWDLETNEEQYRLEGHEKAVLGAAQLDDNRIVSWSEDKSIRTWSLDTGDPLEVMTGHTRPLRDAMVLPDGDILSWSDDKSLRRWSSQGGDATVTMKTHTREVVGALLLDDERVLAWDMDNMVKLWRITDGEELATFEGHSDTPMGAMLLEDDTILTWAKDGLLIRWNQDGSQVKELKGHKDWVDGVLMLSETRAISWSKDMNLILWDMTTNRRLETLTGHAGYVRGACKLATGELLSWSGGGTLRIWDIHDDDTVDVVAVLEGHTAGVRGAMELENEQLLSWSWDGSMRLWEWEKEEIIAEAVGHRGWIHAHSGWGDDRAMTWASDALAVLWDIQSGHPNMVYQGHDKSVDDVIAISDGKLLTYSGDQTLRVWSQDSGECLAEMEGHDKKIQGALELQDGRVLSWSSDAKLKIWEVSDGSCAQVLEGHKKLIQGARQLKDGRVVSWSSDATIKVWDVDTGDVTLDLTEHGKLVKGTRLYDDDTLLSWSSDKTLKLWDLGSGDCKMTLEGHKGLVLDARKLSNDRIISIAKKDPMILWDMTTGDEIMRFETEEDADGATEMDDGTLLAWFRKSDTFRKWDLGTGDLILEATYEEAMEQHPELWTARQNAGRYETSKGAWRSHGLSGGAVLYYDSDDAPPRSVEWKESGSWNNMLLTEDGVVTVHAGQYFHPLHLYLGMNRVTLDQAREHIEAVRASKHSVA